MSENVQRLSAALADRYRIERELGAGGMATVYLASDLKHDRNVAIKVLKPELAAVLGAERFVQEIKTTAALSHPHILPLFDSGEADGFLYYVMPYIQGETIRERLNRETQLSVDEAVRITREIADALDYAHRHGVIHRDIKPENLLLHDGRPMVMDFGIALAVSAAAGGRMTETGLSLGTPHYMSPEQATAEREITNRSDIYSLGSVLYEMLTGEPPHMGNSAQAIIMKIVTEDAQPVRRLRKSVPPNVADAVAKAIERLPADRFDSAGAFAAALGNVAFVLPRGYQGHTATTTARWKERALIPLALVAAVSFGVAVRSWMTPLPTRPVARYALVLPDSTPLVGWARVAQTPDGSRLVYVSPGHASKTSLWVRDRDRLDARRIEGTDGAVVPFLSPDGSSVAYFMNGAIWTVSLNGGTPVLIARNAGEFGGSWGRDGNIYADGAGLGGLVRVAATEGSRAEPFTTHDVTRGEREHTYPEVLPSAKGVLFVVRVGAFDEWEVAVADTKTGQHQALVRGVYARYAKSGHLLFVTASGALMAAPFDEAKMQLTGAAVALQETIGFRGSFRVPDLLVTDDGTLTYGTGGGYGEQGEPVWVERDGRATPVAEGWTQSAWTPSLSPDGTKLAISIREERGQMHLWVRNLSLGTVQKLTHEGSFNYRPDWSANGERVVFMSDRRKVGEIFSRRADGAGEEELVLSRFEEISEARVTRDGNWLVYRQGSNRLSDLYAKRLRGDSVIVPLATSEFLEREPAVSPDGRFLAYLSDETGSDEIFVRPFPDVSAGKWLVSKGGGADPVWSRDGRELFYRDANEALVAVDVDAAATPPFGRQQVLFSGTQFLTGGVRQGFDVSVDGRRFLMIRRVDDRAGKPSLVVIENFFQVLREKVPR